MSPLFEKAKIGSIHIYRQCEANMHKMSKDDQKQAAGKAALAAAAAGIISMILFSGSEKGTFKFLVISSTLLTGVGYFGYQVYYFDPSFSAKLVKAAKKAEAGVNNLADAITNAVDNDLKK